MDPKTGQVDKKAMARKKARREASKEATNDTSKAKALNMLKGFSHTRNSPHNENKVPAVKRATVINAV